MYARVHIYIYIVYFLFPGIAANGVPRKSIAASVFIFTGLSHRRASTRSHVHS